MQTIHPQLLLKLTPCTAKLCFKCVGFAWPRIVQVPISPQLPWALLRRILPFLSKAGLQILQLKASHKSFKTSQACRSLSLLSGTALHHTHSDQEWCRQLPKSSPAA
uniref:Uncharacterized protein n=1 Tax=Geospiza parvula TaxID=87175 RepID=A0A8U8CIT5_GEOPR